MFDSSYSNQKRVLILATGLAFACLVISISTITQSGTKTGSTIPQTTIAQSRDRQAPQDFAQVSDFHLFGQLASASPSFDGVPPETTQQLKLKGVVYLPNEHAYAIIESSDQTQKKHKVNDILPGGAMLQSIETNRIIILTDNRQESLALDKAKSEQAATVEAMPETGEQPVLPQSANDIVIQPPESLSTY